MAGKEIEGKKRPLLAGTANRNFRQEVRYRQIRFLDAYSSWAVSVFCAADGDGVQTDLPFRTNTVETSLSKGHIVRPQSPETKSQRKLALYSWLFNRMR